MANVIDPFTGIVLFLLILAVLIQLGYYWGSYRRLAFLNRQTEPEESQPVSVIICAKNEVKNLRKYLPSVLEQAYHDFEVIVVNDCSWDESGEYLEEMAKNYSRLKVVTIVEQEKYKHGKKFALTLGIKAAKHEVLLMTDADCMPAGKNWISRMQLHFHKNTDIVLGYGAYMREPGFLNKLIRFDTFSIAVQYLSFALGGNPYMGVGRNLAYRKSFFFQNKGFAGHHHIFSGDDDLFVNEKATGSNTQIEAHEDAFTYSAPKMTFGEWFRQKRRHQSTAKFYKPRHKFQLFMIPFSGFLFYGALITLLFNGFDWRILVSLYAAVLLLKVPVLWKNTTRLAEKDLFWLFPVLEPVYLFLQPFIYTANLFTKQQAWK